MDPRTGVTKDPYPDCPTSPKGRRSTDSSDSSWTPVNEDDFREQDAFVLLDSFGESMGEAHPADFEASTNTGPSIPPIVAPSVAPAVAPAIASALISYLT
ncbi:hypothetical protein NMY22_g18307 [Coprinellus aureogranulatus]|nr:hypothetical protein NMY22_g18307 [Coprinellus aureogranulatus]